VTLIAAPQKEPQKEPQKNNNTNLNAPLISATDIADSAHFPPNKFKI
jgi:hypothetical protein